MNGIAVVVVVVVLDLPEAGMVTSLMMVLRSGVNANWSSKAVFPIS